MADETQKDLVKTALITGITGQVESIQSWAFVFCHLISDIFLHFRMDHI